MTIAELLLPEVRSGNGHHAARARARAGRQAGVETARQIVVDGRSRQPRRQHDQVDRRDDERRRSSIWRRVPPEQMNQAAESRAQLLEWFDANAAAARQALAKSDADYFVPWTLKQGEQVFFTMPRYTCIRSFFLNHIVHHRAQLERLSAPQQHSGAGDVRAVGGRRDVEV